MAARRAPRRERRRARGFLLTVQRIRSGRGTERDRREGPFRRMAFEHRTPKRRSLPFELRRPVSPGHGPARPPWTSAGPRFLLGHRTRSSVWRRARAVSSSYPQLTLPVARARNPRIHGQTLGRGREETLSAGPDGFCVRPSVAPSAAPSATVRCLTVLRGLVSDVGRSAPAALGSFARAREAERTESVPVAL